MQAQEVALMEVEMFCGYKDAGFGLLLTVGCNTLVPGDLVMELEAPSILAQPPPLELWHWGAGLDL
jgi:hypothetical protein